MNRFPIGALVLGLGLSSSVGAGFVMELKDGRKVELFKDQTWEFVIEKKEGEEEEANIDKSPLKLQIEKVYDSKHVCKIGMRLTNKSGYYITSVVPRFGAYIANSSVKFDVQSTEFARLRPLRDQYREITYRGITCPDIDYFRLYGADHCSMGELDKYSAPKGACLAQIELLPTDLIKIGKRKPKK